MPNHRPLKPFDQLAKRGRWRRRLRERDPERYEEMVRRERERARERSRTDPEYRAKRNEYKKEWRRQHPEYVKRRLEIARRRYRNDPEYQERVKRQSREYMDRLKAERPEKYRELVRHYAVAKDLRLAKMRAELLSRRGGACERCPCNDIRCLELHHPNGDAAEIRNRDYHKMLRGEMEYTVLCANCHKIEHHAQV